MTELITYNLNREEVVSLANRLNEENERLSEAVASYHKLTERQREQIERLSRQNRDLRGALVGVLRKQDEPSMFRLPNNCAELAEARAVLVAETEQE